MMTRKHLLAQTAELPEIEDTKKFPLTDKVEEISYLPPGFDKANDVTASPTSPTPTIDEGE